MASERLRNGSKWGKGTIITVKFATKCVECKATINVGDKARYYGAGKTYGIGCHERKGRETVNNQGFNKDGTERFNTPCGHEDAPCCGCHLERDDYVMQEVEFRDE